MISLAILFRVVLSVSGNALQKRLLLDGLRVTPMWVATYGLMLAPGLVLAALQPAGISSAFWGNVLLGGLLDATGNLAMVAALRVTDLSIFGPLNAFRPILALLFGWLFLKETPTAGGALGVGITVAGMLILFGGTSRDGSKSGYGRAIRALAFRLSGIALSTIGAVFLKRAALAGSAELTLAMWIACGLACLWGISLARGLQPAALAVTAMRRHGGWLWSHTALFFLMQWLTILIFQRTLLAYSFAYFQLGMALQVLMGAVLFKETAWGRRLAGCAVMGLGSSLVALKG